MSSASGALSAVSLTRAKDSNSSRLVRIVWPTRFYGVKTLNSDKIALEFKNVADEVLAHLRAGDNTNVTVWIEIEATGAEGFNESRVRTVSENARTLKFDQSGFEES